MRVVLTGSECTGKSTLAEALARHYGVEAVPEFVRAFAEQKGGTILFSDHGPIARGQMALEDEYRARAAGLLIQDTDLLSTVVYCRHYFGRSPAWIEDEAQQRRPDIYLVCEPDIPWMADGVRDRGHAREEMQQLFRDAVAASGVANATIRGSREERFRLAVAATRAIATSRDRL